MTTNGIRFLGSVDEWEDVAIASNRELLVVKVSPICEISHMAEREFDAWYGGLLPVPRFAVCKVDVIASRAVSHRIARDLDVRHESPQVLWLRYDRSVKWHASHGRISTDALDAQLNGGR